MTLVLMVLLGVYAHSEVSPPIAGAQEKQNSGVIQCRPVKRQGMWPGNTSSGAWLDGTRLYLLDHSSRRLLEFSVAGKSEGVVYGELARRVALGSPRKIVSLEEGGFYIQTDHNRFTMNNPKGKVKDIVAGPSRESSEIISKVYNFAVVGDEVVAFVDVQDLKARQPEREGAWQQGFVVFPIGEPEAFRWLEKDIEVEEQTFYRLSFPFVAALGGDTAYILRMERARPVLYRYEKGSDELRLVAAFKPYTASHLLPDLPPFELPTDYEPLMRVVERSQMPVGLYGWEGRLYLLERSWTGKKTNWSLRVILDPGNSGNEMRATAIGVEADHLFLVPGKPRWGLVTKGHPTSLQSQEVTSIQFFPSTALEGASLPARLCK